MPNTLDECQGLLVRRWGEMGGYWGINRSMAEIHALLFVTDRPLCTDDVMARLHVSRGNASMNLRALVDWGLVQRVHLLGNRKEYFQADTDVWHMFETIMRERRRREVEPILETIERCRRSVPPPQAGPQGPSPEQVREFTRRLDDLSHFLTTMGTLFELVLRFGRTGVDSLLHLASAVGEPQTPAGGAKTGETTRGRAARRPAPNSTSRARKTNA